MSKISDLQKELEEAEKVVWIVSMTIVFSVMSLKRGRNADFSHF